MQNPSFLMQNSPVDGFSDFMYLQQREIYQAPACIYQSRERPIKRRHVYIAERDLSSSGMYRQSRRLHCTYLAAFGSASGRAIGATMAAGAAACAATAGLPAAAAAATAAVCPPGPAALPPRHQPPNHPPPAVGCGPPGWPGISAASPPSEGSSPSSVLCGQEQGARLRPG